MKVAIVCSSYPPYIKGGGEISTQLLAEGLKKRGVDVVVITASDSSSVETVNGIKVYRVKSPNIYWSYHSDARSGYEKTIWHLVETFNSFVKNRLIPVLEQEKPDILHTSTIEDWSPAVWKVAHQQDCKVVHTLRSYTLLCPRATMFKNGKRCREQCMSCNLLTKPKKMFSQYVNNVVGISNYILQIHLENGYFREAVSHVVYNQVEKHTPEVKNFDNKESLTFGYIGRLHKTKGVIQLLKLFSKSSLREKDSLLVAGSGPEESIVKSYSEKYSSILYIGYTDPELFFEKIDVLIVPSLWNEPFGRVIIESFCKGIPVVASKVGGISELIDEGWNGYLFNSEDFGELLEKMNNLSKNPAIVSELRERLNSYDNSVFKSESVADEYIKVYSS